MREEIVSRAEKSPASKNMLIRHGIPFSEMASYYRAANAYVQTPVEYVQAVEGGSYIHTETMGRTFCEAAASGIPSLRPERAACRK